MTGVEELLSKETEADTTGAKAAKIAAKLSEISNRKCTRQVVEHWVASGHVPGKWAPFVNRVYRIPLHKLNDAIYPKSVA